MPKVLLTGATGFLGSHLLERLVTEGYDVVVLKRTTSSLSNITVNPNTYHAYDIDVVELMHIFEAEDIDCIIHTATLYGREGNNAVDLIKANILFPVELLQLAIIYNVKVFLNTDTFINDKGNKYNYLNNYTLTKSQINEWLANFADKLIIANCKLWHMYGPNDSQGKFIVSIARDILRGVKYLDLTSGTQKRDFIYVADVVDAYMRIVQHCLTDCPSTGFHTYEIGTGKALAVREVVETIKNQCVESDTELRFGAIPQRQGEYSEAKADITALTSLGWTPITPIVDGLRATVQSEKQKLTS